MFLGVGNVNFQFFNTVQLERVHQALIENLVQGIRRITDQFLKENFLVGTEGIDNKKHELGNFCREGKSPPSPLHGALPQAS